MDKSLIEKYKNEMLMLKKKADFKAAAVNTPQQGYYEEGRRDIPDDASDENGRLIAMVTYTDRIYPVKNARVTVFTGSPENMQIVGTAVTDESGKTGKFELPAPLRSLSQQSDPSALPYALYNMMVQSDGFLDNIHLNIPVFRGVTSVQRSDLTPISVAGGRTEPIIFNEFSSYEL
ncbi:MAG: hypothetical protein U0K18_00450 [Acutalibacteraceae bacterium]|nr:hypothetical protein [Acutalibacteraceae bacterium]